MKNALDLVDVIAVDGETSVLATFQLPHNGLIRRCYVDPVNLVTRRHNVVHGHLLEIENVYQHPAMPAGDHRSRFGYDCAELFLRHRIISCRIRRKSHQLQDAIGQPVDRQYQGHQPV